MLDIDSVEWFDPHLTLPTKETVLTYDKDRDLAAKGGDKMRKIHCDLSRICEVEDSVCEWHDSRYFRGSSNINWDEICKVFKVVRFDCDGADGLKLKIQLLAVNAGTLFDK
jgi:hypothetical protein